MSTTTHPIALITGANRGLGKDTALQLAASGSDIILTYRQHAEEAQAVVRQVEALGRKALALRLDVARSQDFATFAADVKKALGEVFGRDRFDHLVNNAGSGLGASFAETTEAEFDQMIAVHLKSAFFLTQKLLPLLADGGRIINISSGLTRFSFPGYAAYAMAKGGVEVLTHYMAKELGARGIAVNVVAPGAIETDFRDGAVRKDPKMQGLIASQTALGRVGQTEDVGGAIASLLRDGTRWITGQRIEVSGGMFI